MDNRLTREPGLKISRRAFAKTAVASPLLVSTPTKASAQKPTIADDTGHFVPWIEARADALRHNASVISEATEGRKIVAVIKTNG
ncbi:MAG: hypothetical protein AAGH38_01855, partial [Pseudomonadota bacterium]